MTLHEGEPPNLHSPPLVSLNHVSFLCRSVENSVKFYQQVLGFDLIKRPSCFDFKGAWLYKYGIAIHLLQLSSLSDAPMKPTVINPKGNHISFQCVDVGMMKKKLGDMGMEYVSATVKEGVIVVEQLFFHDPDGNMIEICDCEKLPVLPLPSAACPVLKMSNNHVKAMNFQW